MVAQEREEIRELPGRLPRAGASELQASAMAAPPSVFTSETRKTVSADMRMSTAGKLPSAISQFTPAPVGPGKRARVVSPPNTTASTPGTRKHVPVHPRQCTGYLSSSGPCQFLQTRPSAHSAHSMFSSDTPMAPPAALQTVNRSSSVPYTPVARPLDSLAINPSTRDITALTPPRLITPTCDVQEAASPQSIAAALERMLSVTQRPVCATSLPSVAQYSSVGLLLSPTSTKPHGRASQLEHHVLDSAPTPHSTPSKPSLPPRSLSALAIAADAEPSDGMLRDRVPNVTSTTSCATPTPGFTSQAFAVPPLPFPSAAAHTAAALLPGMHAQAAMCEEAPTPRGVALAGVRAEPAHSGAASVLQQPFKPHDLTIPPPHNSSVAVAASTPCLRDGLDTTQEHLGTASASMVCTTKLLSPALAVLPEGTASQMHVHVHGAQKGAETPEPVFEPQSPLAVQILRNVALEGCMTQDAGHTPHRILKSASDERLSDEQPPCIERMSSGSPWAPTAPVMDNEAFPNNSGPASRAFETAAAARPRPGASGITPQSVLGLSTENVRMWNMHDAGAGATDIHRSSNDLHGYDGDRSGSMSPVLSWGRMSPHIDPISSPSKWDEEDPLSIYKPQNLVFMPRGGWQCPQSFPVAGASDMVQPTTASELGSALGDTQSVAQADDTAWHSWTLPQQPQDRGAAQDGDTVLGSVRSGHGGVVAGSVGVSTAGQVASGGARSTLARSTPRFNLSGESSKPQC